MLFSVFRAERLCVYATKVRAWYCTKRECADYCTGVCVRANGMCFSSTSLCMVGMILEWELHGDLGVIVKAWIKSGWWNVSSVPKSYLHIGTYHRQIPASTSGQPCRTCMSAEWLQSNIVGNTCRDLGSGSITYKVCMLWIHGSMKHDSGAAMMRKATLKLDVCPASWSKQWKIAATLVIQSENHSDILQARTATDRDCQYIGSPRSDKRWYIHLICSYLLPINNNRRRSGAWFLKSMQYFARRRLPEVLSASIPTSF